jgi:hypothetical protein
MTERDPEMDFYRQSRGIDPASPEWDHLRAWWKENRHFPVDPALMDGALARFRRVDGDA